MAKIYLSGYVEDDNICLPSSSAIVLFILKHCDTKLFEIHFVNDSSDELRFPIEIPQNGFGDVNFLQWDTCPHEIKQCTLPAVRCIQGNKVLSGLCGVLRNIVKVSSSEVESSQLLQLLGHKQICLKACAEVSNWTRFCEVDLPDVVNSLLSQTSTTNNVTLPTELLRLENQFKLPCVVANIKKRLQGARKKGTTAVTNKEVTSPPDKVQTLRHDFVEGPDLTLADLTLFPCICLLLNHWKQHYSSLRHHLPLMFQWLDRLCDMESVQSAMSATGLVQPSSSNICDSSSSIQVPDGHCGSFSVRDVKIKKFKANSNRLKEVVQKLCEYNLDFVGDHPCPDVKLPWKQFPDSVHPKDGDLPPDRLERKCEQLENLAQAVISIAESGHTIVDFCAGGGHLGILLAFLLPNCKVILVENKEESIQRAETRIHKLGLENITIYQCNLDYFRGTFDIGVCLHACGVATDLVMQCCVDNQAAFVICPCCYGGVRDTHTVTYPRSETFKYTDLTYEDYLCLGHGADQTQFNSPAAKQGKECMVYIDSDRASLAVQYGYTVTLTTLQPPQCSPKNNLLIGTKIS